MRRSLLAALALLVALSGALPGQLLTPVLNGINPTQTTAGAPGFVMTLSGSGYVGGVTTVNFGSNTLTPLTTASTQVTVQITSGLLAVARTVDVSVTVAPFNQAPLTSNSQPFTINSPPVITTTSLNAMMVGGVFSQTLAASLGTPPYSNWQVVAGLLPAGLTLNAGTGVVSGIPTTVGSGSALVAVTDNAGIMSASQGIIWSVSPPPLTITTAPALPNATAGAAYSQVLAVSGGIPSYTWSIASGVLPPGLALSTAGTLGGTPTQAGPFSFTVRVADSFDGSTSKAFSLTVGPPTLTITNASPLPNATVAASYSQTLAVTGGMSPYTWSLFSGALPSGLTLSAAGDLSGAPTQSGTFSFTVRVADASGSFTTKAFNLTVSVAALTITTNPPLANATAGSAYSQAFAATGGIPPYTWSVPPGALQSGLTLSAAGLLSGAPTQGGTSNFTLSVADASGSITTKVFTLTVTVPPVTLSATGLTDIVSPAQQPTFDVQLSAAYPLTITGTVTMTFKSNAINPSDDPAIQFSSGGRILNFTIPAGQISAFPTTLPAIQTGTVAGEIDLTLSYFAGGQNITPANPPVRSMTIPRTAPNINSVQVVKVSGGFNILVTGYSTPRQVVQADFTFTPATGATLQTTHATVIVDPVFTTWYTGINSPQFGSLFLYTQPFTVQGNVSDISSVSVTLAHTTGTSAAVSASF